MTWRMDSRTKNVASYTPSYPFYRDVTKVKTQRPYAAHHQAKPHCDEFNNFFFQGMSCIQILIMHLPHLLHRRRIIITSSAMYRFCPCPSPEILHLMTF
ncbi:hypothetical protein ACRALDRAFT_207225 [Sodiomyces alcalophilus JCM 7366]|uniref:uncharacterized protein n=1 Tax=Sodiomyces alcalophilus JCM 7366 TaxID=591952 RepID=UPI0039B60106